MNQALVTVALPFASDRAASVTAVLDRLGNPAEEIYRTALRKTDIVHFMSLSVIPDTAPGQAHLVLELSADGGPEDALVAVCDALRPAVDDALDAAGIDCGTDGIAAYLLRHNLRLGGGWLDTTGIGFCGAPVMSVWRIRNEARIADKIEATMQGLLHGPGRASRKLAIVRETLWAANEKWAFTGEPAPFLTPQKLQRTNTTVALMVTIALVKLAWPLIPVPLLLWWWLGFWPALSLSFVGIVAGLGLAVRHLRHLEKTDPVDDTPPDAAKVAANLMHENTGAQNLLAAVSEVKPGRFRRVLLRFAFGIARECVARMYRPGFLREIGVIHFARWVLVPGTDKLLFFSNFSDGWESYLQDFIMKATSGLTGIWGNTKGFPRTEFLLGGGANDGDRFRRWARRQQYSVSFWYSAYPELKMNRIRRNAAIRQGIAGARSEADAEAWLACFGSEPRPPFMLDKPQIPTLVLGGVSRLRHSACLVLRLPNDPGAARAWLAGVAPSITFGEANRHQPAAAIAFTVDGLRHLGMAEEDLQSFPPAFQNGMASPGRARALGDTPGAWLWGKTDDTHAVLVLFDYDAGRLEAAVDEVTAAIRSCGGSRTLLKRLKDLPPPDQPVIEPFGFVDGVSQPILRDSPRARRPHNADHVVEAGEIVLGYPDHSGFIPSTPTVRAENDRHGILPEMTSAQPGVAPSFTGGGSNGQRDFGRDGTFLVVRHLEQDPPKFHAFAETEAERLSAEANCPFAGQPTDALKALIEAKMVGRWANGSSLVRHPHGPANQQREPDNDFTFGREDPQGFACPFGAHIRRSNPRDSLDTDSASQLALSNCHRILRVGRQYDAASEEELPGLMFMCLNADIERQFEFLQQTWVLGNNFHDLYGEQDPMVGNSAADREFTIPTRQGPVKLRGLQDFVRVLGGGYFFMPGRRSLGFLAGQSAVPGDSGV
jgi:deferrochelatase/peroxidase EfeB